MHKSRAPRLQRILSQAMNHTGRRRRNLSNALYPPGQAHKRRLQNLARMFPGARRWRFIGHSSRVAANIYIDDVIKFLPNSTACRRTIDYYADTEAEKVQRLTNGGGGWKLTWSRIKNALPREPAAAGELMGVVAVQPRVRTECKVRGGINLAMKTPARKNFRRI